jgi:membrane protein DedA with SNARE-associated domain
MQSFTLKITELIYSVPELLRYALIFFCSFIEGVPVIGSIFPGGTVALLIGSLSEGGFIHPLFAVLIITVGTFSGDMIGFVAGRYLKNHRWLKRFMENEKHKKGWDIFDRHVAILIIFGKLIPVIRSTPSIFAAMRGMRFRRYVAYSAIGSVVWAFAGVYGGNALSRILGDHAAILVILAVLVISGIAFAVQRINSALQKKKPAA